jgi:hypothetical protein
MGPRLRGDDGFWGAGPRFNSGSEHLFRFDALKRAVARVPFAIAA